LLIAYIDDELDTSQRGMVGAALEQDADLRRRAEEMRLSRDLLREAFPLESSALVPAGIESAADRLASAARQQMSVSEGRASRFPLIYAIAAALVLCTVAVAAYIARQPATPTPRTVTALTQIDSGGALHTLLEDTPSGHALAVPDEEATLRAILTFRADDGRFCREFEILANASSSAGVACRENGQWHTEVWLRTAAAEPSSQHYTPASGGEDPAVAIVVERLTQQDPFGAAEEARLLAANWLQENRDTP
jgi:hypothetical protein